MNVKKVLFITQEITPYVAETPLSWTGRHLPQAVQESGREIRTFMPRWGGINERRNQLHEVIRLSGMNIIIDDTDHPLIIKVASIQAARMQVYFIDNDDFFHRRNELSDTDGTEYTDNAERAVFYARGVLETMKKLRWRPDVIYCQGWISAIAPLYVKTAYHDEPSFADVSVVYSPYGEQPAPMAEEDFKRVLAFRNVDKAFLDGLGLDLGAPGVLNRLAVAFSDGVIEGEAGRCADALDYARGRGLPVLAHPGTDMAAVGDFFEQVYGASHA